jgi:dihydrofolate reductase
MGKVILDMAMSLDGFIAGPNGADVGLHDWYFAPAGQVAKGDAKVVAESINTLGAIILGRRTYDLGEQQDGFVDNPHTATHFVLTHEAPKRVAKGNTKFVFVADGIESALEQAKAAARDKDVAIGGGANNAQQYLKAGLLDAIQIHLAPILIGEGIRLFDHLGATPIKLESTRVIASPRVTHLLYSVIK